MWGFAVLNHHHSIIPTATIRFFLILSFQNIHFVCLFKKLFLVNEESSGL